MGLAMPDEVAAAPELAPCRCPCSHNEWQHHNGECAEHDAGGDLEHAYAEACYRQIEQDHTDDCYRRMEEEDGRQMQEECRMNWAEEERYGMPLADPLS